MPETIVGPDPKNMLEILATFCAEEGESRYSLHRPFVHPSMPGYVFATDTRVLIRAPAAILPESIEPSDAKKLPDVSHVVNDDIIGRARFGAVLERGRGKVIDCLRCHGDGKIERLVEECSECDGTGGGECPTCGHEYDCEACDGTGGEHEEIPCPHCGGKGKFAPDVITLGKKSLSFDPGLIDRTLKAFGADPVNIGLWNHGVNEDMAIFTAGDVVVIVHCLYKGGVPPYE